MESALHRLNGRQTIFLVESGPYTYRNHQLKWVSGVGNEASHRLFIVDYRLLLAVISVASPTFLRGLNVGDPLSMRWATALLAERLPGRGGGDCHDPPMVDTHLLQPRCVIYESYLYALSGF